jgi:hypothetical protein
LIDWNPRHLYRKLFAGDEAGMEHFLSTVCTHEWNRCQDAGRSFAEGARLLKAEHPRWAFGSRSGAPVGKQVFADCPDRGTTAAVGGFRPFVATAANGEVAPKAAIPLPRAISQKPKVAERIGPIE